MTNPYAPPQAAVADVVDPAAGILLADRGTRLGAAFLDGLIFWVMVYLPIVGGAVIAAIPNAGTRRAPELGDFGPAMILGLIGFVIWAGINIKFMKANGQSIGKKATRIKVVRSDGSAASLSRLIWLRNVLNTVISIIPLYGIIEVLFIFGESRRCLHDHLADTIVIKA